MKNPDLIENRKQIIINFLKEHKKYAICLILGILMLVSYKIRTLNLNRLIDVTTGKYIPAEYDATIFLRYAKYILENGSLMSVDWMRYYPLGFEGVGEFNLLSYFIVYLYKFLHFFNSSITLEYVDVIFPAITFAIALIPFYFLVKKLFEYKTALLSTASIIFTPALVEQTMSGVGDKEALLIIFYFFAIYFYILSLKLEHKYSYLWGFASGISTAIIGSTWGGVNILFLIIGGTTLILIATDNFSKKDFYSYLFWIISTFVLIDLSGNPTYPITNIHESTPSQLDLLALLSGSIYYLIKHKNIFNAKEKLNIEKFPVGLLSIFLSITLALIAFIYYYDFSFLIDRIINFYVDLSAPFSKNRFLSSINESQESSVEIWFYVMGKMHIAAFLAASIYLFYSIFSDVKKYRVKLTIIYSIFILCFVFSKYSLGSILNGKTPMAQILYFGSFIIFAGFLLYYYLFSFYQNKKPFKAELNDNDKNYNLNLGNDKELHKKFITAKKEIIFLFVSLFISIVAARSAVRLIFMLAPITTILASYILIKLFDYSLKTRDSIHRAICILLIIIMFVVPFIDGNLIDNAGKTIISAETKVPYFTEVWQRSMAWVRENTPKESVFAHWWDYGYWVQTFGERATLSDGGNARGAINHFIGRHLLTGRNNTEALELLKTHNATHVLISYEDIAKYGSISSIGSDNNLDRLSSIFLFIKRPDTLKDNMTKKITYIYDGLAKTDEEFIFNNKVFPKGSKVIGVLISLQIEDKKVKFWPPSLFVSYNGMQEEVPIKCVFVDHKEYKFNNDGYEGCLFLFPKTKSYDVAEEKEAALVVSEEHGAALLIQPKIRDTLFMQLYLFDMDEKENKELLGFKKVYDSTNYGFPLIFNSDGNYLSGPIKIWELNYPDYIKTNSSYLITSLPELNFL